MKNMDNFAIDPKFVKAFKRLAVAFLVRAEHFDGVNAVKEVDMIINRIGLTKLVENTKLHYVRMTRKGARVALNRAKRLDIVLTLENAINHASIEAGYY